MITTSKITFPEFSGLSCIMMKFIQGDSSSLPLEYQAYSDIIDSNYLEKGEIGYLTIDESFVEAGSSQRGFNSTGIDRNVHIEVGRCSQGNRWGSGGNNWGGRATTLLDDSTMVLIANSIDDTCRIWDNIEFAYTKDGDLSHIIDKYAPHTGRLLKSGEVARISIFTPHECIPQTQGSKRQFFRIVGRGVRGGEPYFTPNPKMRRQAFSI